MTKLINIKTGAIVGTYKTARAAHRAAERLNREYGAVLYGVSFA
jgi:hypothetical protein